MTPDEVYDTPAGLLDKMMMAENVYKSFQEFEKIQPGQGALWVKNNPEKWQIVVDVNGW